MSTGLLTPPPAKPTVPPPKATEGFSIPRPRVKICLELSHLIRSPAGRLTSLQIFSQSWMRCRPWWNMEQEELSDFDKGQVVVARELGLSVSQTAKMLGCSRAAVVSAYRQWYEEGLRLRAGRPRLIDPKELDDESESESESEQTGGEEAAEEEATADPSEEGQEPKVTA
ncbi:hypothetical protein GOODEAATRI_021489, partial [Goodea atripinnis]